ncbi:MAG: DUF1232 domain-containing protein [Thermoanaerobaculia bacterium]|nr:DUF1232 domain-containing protein [Thermoanaerobaculia bacterium]
MRGEPPSTGLLSFYDRLRRRIEGAARRRGGRLGRGAAEALLLAPDLLLLLARLSLDPRVPVEHRRLIGGALLYFLAPVDLLPEAFVGVGGFLDDLVLACGVLASAFGPELEPLAASHWSGRREIGEVLRDVSRVGEALVGGHVMKRIDRLIRLRPRRPPSG